MQLYYYAIKKRKMEAKISKKQKFRKERRFFETGLVKKPPTIGERADFETVLCYDKNEIATNRERRLPLRKLFRKTYGEHFRQTRTILNEKVKEALSSVLPITAIVLILCFTISPVPTEVLLAFLVGAVLLIVGMGLFTLGADTAMTPIG